MAATKKTPKTAEQIAANEKRLATMRANLEKLEKRAHEILFKGPENMTQWDRFELLQLLSINLHKTGKIEGIFSIDSTAACEFCMKMREAAQDNILIICGSCYAAADEYKEASWRRHKLNAAILSTVLFSEAELSALAIGPLCRINEDGDTPNSTYARNIFRVARSHPAVHFGYWYKNSPAIERGLIMEGYTSRASLPNNIRFIHSSLLIGFAAPALWFDDAIFTVYPDHKTTAAAIAAGAHECNGRKCGGKDCHYNCYLMRRREAAPLQIAEYLRCSADRRARIMEAYQARKARIAA